MTPTIGGLLRQRAGEIPDRTFLRFRDIDLTYREVGGRAQALATGLSQLGVGAGDPVATLLPNCPDAITLWFAANLLGAVASPVNTAYRGQLLAHILNLSHARVLVVDGTLIGAVAEIAADLRFVTNLLIRGDPATAVEPLTCAPLSSITPVAGHRPDQFLGTSNPFDLAILLSTSGTTGPSKLCGLSHRYAIRQAELLATNLRLTADDVLYCPFPLFHLDAAILTVIPALVLGGVAAISERFSVSAFWTEVRAFGATVFDFMGATLTLLHRSPATPHDRDNTVRLAWGVPVPEFAPHFEARFGLRLVELYGSTDAGVPVYQPLDQPRRPGSCGRPVSSYDVRLFDYGDNEVETGAIGEVVVRPNEPGLIASGYYGMPDETLSSRRNLWFHTGDLARFDEDGYLYFTGRLSDVIRRRGENISAFEVEEVVKGHPDVLDAAAFGVPSDLTEEDVMLTVLARPRRTINYDSLISYCQGRMAQYMIPRYIDVVTDLPRTPTEKIQKRQLIERGVTSTTWDRHQSGGPNVGSPD